jgi:cytochrome c oxidase assembly protein subunit 11
MDTLAEKNKKVLRLTIAVALGMVALSFMSVPVYRLVCQVTGWGGTTQMVAANETETINRPITVRFNAETAPNMPWKFTTPPEGPVTLNLGADGYVAFTALNTSKTPVAGTAIYNVTPLQAGKYFFKTQCFCFGEQLLKPGEKVNMPVAFYVDPKIADDPDLKNLKTITLSYTFFRKDSAELEKAMEKFTSDQAG